jgi:hypothetical protein
LAQQFVQQAVKAEQLLQQEEVIAPRRLAAQQTSVLVVEFLSSVSCWLALHCFHH